MKQVITVILLIAFATQTFTKGLIILDYYTNTASFEKNCVNKNNPCMHCCGKCQLRKRLQQEDNKDKQNPDRRNDNKDKVFSCESFFATAPTVTVQELHIRYSEFSFGKEIKMPHSFFHPPGA